MDFFLAKSQDDKSNSVSQNHTVWFLGKYLTVQMVLERENKWKIFLGNRKGQI